MLPTQLPNSVVGMRVLDTLWRATACDGLRVFLQQRAWEHILEAHPKMWQHRQKVKETVEAADGCQTVSGRKRHYYRTYADLAKGQDGIRVVVKTNRAETTGYIATAFACEQPDWVT